MSNSKAYSPILKIESADWKAEEWFYLGDVHGDLVAMQSIFFEIRNLCPAANIVLVGDIVDRGPQSMEAYRFLRDEINKSPGKIFWIAGNHDEGVFWNDTVKAYESQTAPCEFVDCLNDVASADPSIIKEKTLLGRDFVDHVKSLPRAILMPDGLLVVHGGFPLRDLWAETPCLEELETPKALQDFVWARAASAPKRQVNRYTKGCSYGYKDFIEFTERMKDILPAKRLLCGHEHVDGCFLKIPKADPFILVLNSFSFDVLNEPWTYETSLGKAHFARHKINELPEIHVLQIAKKEPTNVIPTS